MPPPPQQTSPILSSISPVLFFSFLFHADTCNILMTLPPPIFFWQRICIKKRYILLKERNMLLTVKQDALRAQERFPAPDRLRKVRHSMRSVKVVIGERERAAQAAAEYVADTFEDDTTRQCVVVWCGPIVLSPPISLPRTLSALSRPGFLSFPFLLACFQRSC